MENDEFRDDELVQETVTEEAQPEQESEDGSNDYQVQLKERDDEIIKLKAILARQKKKAEDKPKAHLQEQPTEDEDIATTVKQLKLAEDKRRFGYENGLSPEETDAIFKINPNPTKETLEDPFVKGGLERIRQQNRVDENTPRTSRKSSSFIPTSKKELTPAEKQAAFEKRRDEILRSRR